MISRLELAPSVLGDLLAAHTIKLAVFVRQSTGLESEKPAQSPTTNSPAMPQSSLGFATRSKQHRGPSRRAPSILYQVCVKGSHIAALEVLKKRPLRTSRRLLQVSR